MKLDDVPVVDRSGSNVNNTAQVQPATGAEGALSSVAPVAIDPSANAAAGPTGVARVVYFDYDSYVIKPEYQSLIESHSRYIKAGATRRIAIEGHTDERGGREYNLALGQKRAEAVRRALGLLGVTDSQVEAVSFGKEKPTDGGSGEATWAKNRRAEIAYR